MSLFIENDDIQSIDKLIGVASTLLMYAKSKNLYSMLVESSDGKGDGIYEKMEIDDMENVIENAFRLIERKR